MSRTPPRTYAEWKHCITVQCGIPLTNAFVGQRLAALRNDTDHATRRFVEVWGEAHRRAVIGWFEEAGRELAAGTLQ